MRIIIKSLVIGLLICSGIQPLMSQEFEREAGFQPFDEAEDQFKTPKVVEKKRLMTPKESPFNEREGLQENLQENLSPRISTPQHPERQMLITARAIYRARQRVSRIESRKRQGHSRLRPTVWGGQQHLINLNAFNSYNSYLDAPWLGGVYSYR